MRSFSKALLALSFMAQALPAVGAPPGGNPEAPYIRIERSQNGEPISLQTSIVKYVEANGSTGVEIDLIGVVHIGDRGYYERLNEVFKKYDTVLYELVAPEGTRPERGGAGRSDNPLAMMQMLMKTALRLDHQIEFVDYKKPNLVHADLSVEGLKKAMRDRGEDEMSLLFKVVKDFIKKSQARTDKPQVPEPELNIADLMDIIMNPIKLKRIMAVQFEENGGGLGETLDQLIVVDRNKAALEVLKQQLRAGKKRIAIFYGAAHMPDFDKRLREEFGMKPTTSEWLTAWNMSETSSRN